MSRALLILFVLIGCCYCLDSNDLLVEETRAKKKKDRTKLLEDNIKPQASSLSTDTYVPSNLPVSNVTLKTSRESIDTGMILLFIFSKVVIFKAASTFFMMAFFQKLFYLFGLFLNYFLRSKSLKPTPSPVYGAPSDYNTIGYSYGPPEHESLHTQDNGYPGVSELRGAFDWLVNKNVK